MQNAERRMGGERFGKSEVTARQLYEYDLIGTRLAVSFFYRQADGEAVMLRRPTFVTTKVGKIIFRRVFPHLRFMSAPNRILSLRGAPLRGKSKRRGKT